MDDCPLPPSTEKTNTVTVTINKTMNRNTSAGTNDALLCLFSFIMLSPYYLYKSLLIFFLSTSILRLCLLINLSIFATLLSLFRARNQRVMVKYKLMDLKYPSTICFPYFSFASSNPLVIISPHVLYSFH